jgi:membrane-bound ClpP family serine protease
MVGVSHGRGLVFAAAALAVVAVVGTVAFVLASVRATVPIAWLSGLVLGLLLVLTWVLCAHVGGHVWLVPIPALALAVAWATTAAVGSWSAPSTWWLAGASAAVSAAGVVLAAIAMGQPPIGVRGREPPAPGAEGTAVTPLSPIGVVQVAGETWTAESVSGPLAAGSPIHIVRVSGLRLLVWSEIGTVPGADALES